MIFRIVILIEIAVMLVYCGLLSVRLHFRFSSWFGFLFRERRMRVLEIQVSLSLLILMGLVVKVFLHDPLSRVFPGWTILLVVLIAALKFFFGFFALFGSREFISLEDVATALRFNYSVRNQADVAEEVVLDMMDDLSGKTLTQVISRMSMRSENGTSSQSGARPNGGLSLTGALFGGAKSWDEGSLVSRFQRMMQDEQLFLTPGLTLSDVADRLHSNKTYISKMVNQTYGVGFPEVLNILRVDYAQQYVRKHPDASQVDVAKASGFVSASSFNTVFKRITGYTPKVWAAQKQ